MFFKGHGWKYGGKGEEEERVWGWQEMSAPASFYSSLTSLQRQGQAVTAMLVCVAKFVCA